MNKKTIHDTKPNKLSINKLGEKKYEIILNENIEEVLIEDEVKYESYLTLKIVGFTTIDELKGEIIKLKYTINQENSLINKGIEDKTNHKYVEYRNYVEEVKSFVNNYFNVGE